MEADVQYKQETKQRAEEQLEYASKVAEQSASEANVAKARAAGEAKALAAALEREVTNPNPNPKSKPDPEPSPNPSPNPNLDPPLTLSRTPTLDPKPDPTQAAALASPLLLAPLPVDWEEINDDDAGVYYYNSATGASSYARTPALTRTLTLMVPCQSQA